MVKYEYRTLVKYKPSGGGYITEWLNSVFPINVGDYLSLPSYNIKTRKKEDVVCKVIEILKVENI